MANFRKKGAKWEAAINKAGVRKSRSFPTKKAAQEWASQTEYEIEKMRQGVSLTHTMRDVFERYMEEVSEDKKGARWELIRLQKFCTYPLAQIKLAELRREDIEDWIADRLKTVKSSSVNRELNLLSHCLTMARRWRWMAENPMQDLRRPRNPPPRDRRIYQGEIKQILAALQYSESEPVILQEQKTALAFLVAIETAMRAGEIASLLRKNTDLKKRFARLEDTKNGTGRNVPLTTEAVRLLKRLPEEGETYFNMRSGVISTLFKRGVNRTNIENLTFHDTRHEAITRLAKKLDVLDLARAVGHKNIKQLQTYYNATAEEIAAQLD